MNEVGYEGQICGPEQAERAKMQAWEAVKLLERARELLAEDSVTQPAVKHLNAALYEAKARATVLEDWHERTYGDGGKGDA